MFHCHTKAYYHRSRSSGGGGGGFRTLWPNRLTQDKHTVQVPIHTLTETVLVAHTEIQQYLCSRLLEGMILFWAARVYLGAEISGWTSISLNGKGQG